MLILYFTRGVSDCPLFYSHLGQNCPRCLFFLPSFPYLLALTMYPPSPLHLLVAPLPPVPLLCFHSVLIRLSLSPLARLSVYFVIIIINVYCEDGT